MQVVSFIPERFDLRRRPLPNRTVDGVGYDVDGVGYDVDGVGYGVTSREHCLQMCLFQQIRFTLTYPGSSKTGETEHKI